MNKTLMVLLAFCALPAFAAAQQPAALRIVSHIAGVRTTPPRSAPSSEFPDGPLAGNGCLGLALQGRDTSRIDAYIGREDFWSQYRGRIMPVGSLRLHIPALRSGAYLTRQNIGAADITGDFSKTDGARLRFTVWTAQPQNMAVFELRNAGSIPLPVYASLRDAWNTPGARGMQGADKHALWLNTSPESVDARIGEPSGRDPAPPFSGSIRDVQVLPYALAPARITLPEYMPYPKARFRFSAKSAAGPLTRLHCGYLAMPQRSFTVSAWVNPSAPQADGAIFSAMCSFPWTHWPVPGPPQVSYGFSLSLRSGKLSAMLNRVRVTALQPLKPGAWQHVAAVYNGRTLQLVVNGVPAGTTSGFPAAAQVAGPQWNWNAIHPGDSKLPFQGTSAVARMAARVEGVKSTVQNGTLSFTLQPGQSAHLLLAVPDSRDTPAYKQAALNMVHLSGAGLRTLWNNHTAWWNHFWSRSYIQIPNKTVENFWYGSLYLLACCSRPDSVSPGLWGNFITSPNMAWNGDYTLDYNYEAPFWAAWPTNHAALAENYDAPLLYWMKRGEGLAAHRGYQGIFYYCHLSPAPGWSGDGAKSIRQKSDALFATVNCIQRWMYTRDARYARRIYPFLRGVAQFWDGYLKLQNGVYMDDNDAADELHSPTDVNPATSVAFLHLLYHGLLDINRTLHIKEPLRAQWQHIYRHLPPLPVVQADSIAAIVHAVGLQAAAGKEVIRNTWQGSSWINMGDRFLPNPPVHQDGSSAGMNSHQAIFPGLQVGLDSSQKLLQAARNTIAFQKTWYDFNNDSSFYPAAACVGYNPKSILHHMRLSIQHFTSPSFVFHMGGGGTENFAVVPAAVCMMLMQSYQGSIHLFADWPRSEDASFGGLLACGDFLVSSALRHGRVAYAAIQARAGGVCRLVNPWPGKKAALKTSTGKTMLLSGTVFAVPVKRGETLRFSPSPK